MGDVIDFAEKQKGRRKKKAFSIPPILRKFRVHAIRLLASIIKSGSYSVAYIVKKITGKLIKLFAMLTIFVFGGVSGNPRKFRHSALWNFLGGWSAA